MNLLRVKSFFFLPKYSDIDVERNSIDLYYLEPQTVLNTIAYVTEFFVFLSTCGLCFELHCDVSLSHSCTSATLCNSSANE